MNRQPSKTRSAKGSVAVLESSVTASSIAGAPQVAVAHAHAAVASSTRLLSLDVFRGITIAAMVLVNNPGTWDAVYDPLEHAAWNGWTPTDLIFPFFVFIVGVAMTYSLGQSIEQGASRGELLLKTAKRAASIFAVGLLLHTIVWLGYGFDHLRVPGVLQRIAIAYLLAAGIYLYSSVRGQVVAIIALLFGYWALQTLVPVPGGAAGVLEPGKDLGSYLDRAIFSTDHLWRKSKTWDPEGLLSTLPAIATALLGGLTGAWIRSGRAQLEKVAGLFVVASAGVLAGVVWNEFFPINKNLWTSSFVVFTAALAVHLLALCYYLIDVKGYRKWATPFVIYGSNAIAAYFLSSVGSVLLDAIKVGDVGLKAFIFTNFYSSWLRPVDASLLFALTYVLFWLALMTVLYRKKIFIKL
jgi:predicted acyltransferase